jgi:hypothetical protein
MKTLACTIGLLLAAWLPSATVTADVITVYPIKDNTLIQSTTGSKSNGQGDIFVGQTNDWSLRRGLIQFDVAGSIPAGSTVTDVTLTLREVKGLNGDRLVSLYRVLRDWGEGSSYSSGGGGANAAQDDATWLYTFYNALEPASSPAWSNPGGDFSTSPSGSTLVSDGSGTEQSFSWRGSLCPQMVADVQDWLDHPSANFGWGLLGDETTNQTAKRFSSREAVLKPMLTVTYEPIPEPATIALLAIGSAVLVIFLGVARVRVPR